jgi:hypothetical protein
VVTMRASTAVSVVRPITPDQAKELDSYTGLNKPVEFKNKYEPGKVLLGKIIDEVGFISFDYKYVIQKIELAPNISWDGSRYAYRSGYYTFDGNLRKVFWGQYHACLSEREYEQLLALARAKGWPVL